jgi:cobalamin biosynthesis Mg chelatase CobN
MRRRFSIVGPLAALALLVGAVFFLQAGPAAAATPCWKKLINDWYDGRIDSIYPIHCYRDAIHHLPTDVQEYSSARDDINRALLAVIAKDKGPKGGSGAKGASATKSSSSSSSSSSSGSASSSSSSSTTSTSTHKSGSSKATTTTTSKSHSSTTPTATSTTATPTEPGRKKGTGPVTAVFFPPKHADSVPIPLIVLGSLAFVLILAGATGLVLRKMQARRVQIQPGPPPPEST